MSFYGRKRTFAVFAAVFLLVFLMLSPMAELYGKHDHGCSPNRCLICLVSSAFSELKVAIGAFLCSAAIFLYIYVCTAVRNADISPEALSPVALKTKINS